MSANNGRVKQRFTNHDNKNSNGNTSHGNLS